jgi:hypothetical protein
MDAIEQIEKIYYELDNYYSSKEFQARRMHWNRKEVYYQQIRSINDQAYFLFAFTRLEERIKTTVNTQVSSKTATARSWSRRKTWLLIKTRIDRNNLHFMEYVSLLAERGTTIFNSVKSLYDDRNTIAHGGTATSIIMSTTLGELKRLYRAFAA